MLTLPIKTIPSQSFSAILSGNQWDITLRETSETISCTLVKNGAEVVQNARAVAGMRILQSEYQEDGNFAIISNDQSVPDYTKFGISQFLVYITPEELAISRAPPDDQVPLSYFDPLGGLPLRFAPQGYSEVGIIRHGHATFSPHGGLAVVGQRQRRGAATISPHAAVAAVGRSTKRVVLTITAHGGLAAVKGP